jgi:hypothetical protein
MRRIVLILLAFALATGPVLAAEAPIGGKIMYTDGNKVENVFLILVPTDGNTSSPVEIRIASGKFVTKSVPVGAYYPEMKDKSLRIVKMDFEARDADRKLVGEFLETIEPGEPAPTFKMAEHTRYVLSLVVKKVEIAEETMNAD